MHLCSQAFTPSARLFPPHAQHAGTPLTIPSHCHRLMCQECVQKGAHCVGHAGAMEDCGVGRWVRIKCLYQNEVAHSQSLRTCWK